MAGEGLGRSTSPVAAAEEVVEGEEEALRHKVLTAVRRKTLVDRCSSHWRMLPPERKRLHVVPPPSSSTRAGEDRSSSAVRDRGIAAAAGVGAAEGVAAAGRAEERNREEAGEVEEEFGEEERLAGPVRTLNPSSTLPRSVPDAQSGLSREVLEL